ncbi:hypothetical protein H8356DRAFT_968202, partial [Neocallimastix lanati (nom. inval.)]
DVDSLGECEGDNIYIVQVQKDENTDVKKEIQLTAKITKIINLVIDNQKLKDKIKVNKNPTEKVKPKDSQKKDHLVMITQVDSVPETIKKVRLEKLLSIGIYN